MPSTGLLNAIYLTVGTLTRGRGLFGARPQLSVKRLLFVLLPFDAEAFKTCKNNKTYSFVCSTLSGANSDYVF